ncbi:MAG: hypothetical protein QW063_00050 [Candidatus Nanoarchaeia archaeon]
MGEPYLELIQQARKQIELADHMIYVTYPLVLETKFLLAIMEHIINAARFAVQALLEFEFYYKRLDAYNKTFVSEISIYKNKVAPRYKLDVKYFKLLQKLLDIQKFDKDSVVRFKKGEKYILSTSESNLSVLDLELIKRYSNLTKKFVTEISNIIQKERSLIKISGKNV